MGIIMLICGAIVLFMPDRTGRVTVAIAAGAGLVTWNIFIAVVMGDRFGWPDIPGGVIVLMIVWPAIFLGLCLGITEGVRWLLARARSQG